MSLVNPNFDPSTNLKIFYLKYSSNCLQFLQNLNLLKFDMKYSGTALFPVNLFPMVQHYIEREQSFKYRRKLWPLVFIYNTIAYILTLLLITITVHLNFLDFKLLKLLLKSW